MFNEALRINPAYTEAALNLAVTSTTWASTARPRTIYERAMAASKSAPRSWTRSPRARSRTCTPTSAPPTTPSACTRRRCANTSSALALCPTFVDIRTKLGKTLPRDGRHDRRGPRVRARARREPAVRRRARLQLGLIYYAAGAARGRRRRMAGRAGGRRRRTARPRCTSRCWNPRRPRRTRSRRTSADGERRRCRADLHPSPERFVVEEVPAYAPSGEGTHTFLWIEKRGLTTFDAIARLARAFGLARATSATPG